MVKSTSTYEDALELTVKIDGKRMEKKFSPLSVIVYHAVNRIPFARLEFADGDKSKQLFEVSDEVDFTPGKSVEIFAGDLNSQNLVFKGILTMHAIRTWQGKSFLEIEARNEATKLTLGRKNNVSENSTDSDAIKNILKTTGLKGIVVKTDILHQALIQSNVTDWDFIVSRAEVNGCFVISDEAGVHVQPLSSTGSNKFQIENGTGVLEFEAEMDARHQPSVVSATSWSSKNQRNQMARAKEPRIPDIGNVSSSDLAEAMDFKQMNLSNSGMLNENETQTWADTQLMKCRLARVRGKARISGTHEITPGKVITLKGWGKRFNGEVFVTAVRHELVEKTWFTVVQFGLEPGWFAERYDLQGPDASGIIPAVSGLYIGKVTQLEGDPNQEERIKVSIPALSEKQEPIWARLSMLDAGPNRGSFFRPEIGDEVILGFMNNDPRMPVVLGSLHSSASPAPSKASDANDLKGVLTRGNLALTFDDKSLSINIESPKGNLILLSENEGGIFLEDENGNKIEMSKDGITIQSTADISLKASGNIEIEGGDIMQTANHQFKADGTAGLELSSGATAVLKGSLVEIN